MNNLGDVKPGQMFRTSSNDIGMRIIEIEGKLHNKKKQESGEKRIPVLWFQALFDNGVDEKELKHYVTGWAAEWIRVTIFE